MIMVDSSVWIDFFNGRSSIQTDFLNSILGSEEVCVGDLILIEVLQGFSTDKDLKSATDLFNDLLMYDLVGKEVAFATAQNYRELRQNGVTIRKTIDMVIGTFCILKGMKLLHSDRDFEPMIHHLNLQSVF